MDVKQHIACWLNANDGEGVDSLFVAQKEKTKDIKFKEILGRGYAIEHYLDSDTILFLGMNPSYDEKVPGDSNKPFYPEFGHCYYSRIKGITTAVNKALGTSFPFAHHDLYFVRNTSQKEVIAMKMAMPDFFEKQLRISKSIIEASKPKIIVVANAGASKIFMTEMYNLAFGTLEDRDQNLGAHFIKVGDSRIPVLFTGMISGQRALDEGSYNTLIWHICHILRSI